MSKSQKFCSRLILGTKVKSQKFPKRGFSMVELLIVLLIIIIMTGVLLVNQNSNRSQEDVEAAARKVAAQLRQLQNEALSGKQIGGVSACDFYFLANGTATYNIGYGRCDTHALMGALQSIDINTQKNVTAETININLISPRGALFMPGTKQVILTSTKDGSVEASVCVCDSGNIFEKKDASACGC